MSYLRSRIIPLALALAVLVSLPAAAGELAGVTLPDRATISGEELELNGMGLRKKFFIKVYVGGLYLPEARGDARAILAADEPRRMVMHFLYDVDKGKICEAWDEGLENNVDNPSDRVTAQFADLCDLMVDFEDGDEMSFTYVPGEGTTVNVGGEDVGTLEGKPFADAIASTWLGPEPPSKDFKEGLLGQ